MMTDLNKIKPNKNKALMLAKRQLSELVCDAVNLEGINMTLPEVQTLLDGITVGGHKLSDEKITLNQANAWRFLFESIDNNAFDLSKTFVCKLHDLAAETEALEWGQFRTGNVTIAGTDYLPPKPVELGTLWEQITTLPKHDNPLALYTQAIGLFLDMARSQFFYDVNKRTGRMMMNGLLLQHGYPAINLPAKRQLEFNQLMLEFYQSNQKQPMIDFMISCLDTKIIQIMQD